MKEPLIKGGQSRDTDNLFFSALAVVACGLVGAAILAYVVWMR